MADTTPTLDLTGLINSHLNQISTIKTEVSKLKDMVDAVFTNDSTYQSHDAAVKEAVKVRNGTKKQLQKLPQVADLLNRIQDMKQQIKDNQNQLSQYLTEYAKSTNATTFETDDGQVRQIIFEVKLVRVGA